MPPNTSMSVKRIHREIADLKKEDLGDIITLAPTDNMYLWKGSIKGPEGSPYEGGVFNLEVHLAPDYPFSAPKVLLTTRIYHMNISDRGSICIDILKHNWSPALSLFKVMLSLSSLLTDPNPQDPLVPSIATEFIRNRAQHDQTARQWTMTYAVPRPAPPQPVASSSSSAPPSISSNPAPRPRRNRTRMNTDQPGPSSSTTPTRMPADTIVIDDSDDESASRRRVSGQKRRRGQEGDVLDTADEQEVEAMAGGNRRKRQALGPDNEHAEDTRAFSDVIVLDDD